jgi:hypothetical protein
MFLWMSNQPRDKDEQAEQQPGDEQEKLDRPVPAKRDPLQSPA